MTKPRRARAVLVPGEQPAERGVHAQVASPRLGEDQATATPAASGPSSCRRGPLPARRPPGATPARAAHALRPPLKGPVRSRRGLRLPQPFLCPQLPLGCRWACAPLSPLSQDAAKPVQSCRRSSQRAKLSSNSAEGIPGSEGPRSGIS